MRMKEGERMEKSEDYGLIRGKDFPQAFYDLLLPSPCVKAGVYNNLPIPENTATQKLQWVHRRCLLPCGGR